LGALTAISQDVSIHGNKSMRYAMDVYNPYSFNPVPTALKLTGHTNNVHERDPLIAVPTTSNHTILLDTALSIELEVRDRSNTDLKSALVVENIELPPWKVRFVDMGFMHKTFISIKPGKYYGQASFDNSG
jgi:hypothetical protein